MRKFFLFFSVFFSNKYDMMRKFINETCDYLEKREKPINMGLLPDPLQRKVTLVSEKYYFFPLIDFLEGTLNEKITRLYKEQKKFLIREFSIIDFSEIESFNLKIFSNEEIKETVKFVTRYEKKVLKYIKRLCKMTDQKMPNFID